MQLINKENNSFEFLIETLDDIWVLSQFIVPGDRVFGKSERKVKIGSETNYKVVKKIIHVNLLVSAIKFENNMLRVTGGIENETQFTAIGASHTLSYNVGDKIQVEKSMILKYEEKLINNAIKSKKSHYLLIMLDKDELITCEFSNFSYTVLFEQSGLGSKKYHLEQINEEEQKYRVIEELIKRDYSKIILAGPGIFKDKLQKYIKDKIGLETISFSWNDVNMQSVQKVIQKVKESGILVESQLSYESEYITKLLENINKGLKYAYGFDNVESAVIQGKVEVFLISTKFIDKKKDDGSYLTINSLMRLAENTGGELVIVDSKNETGKILDGIGGIGAILRY